MAAIQPNILCVAEPFGFGPVSKLAATVKALNGLVKTHFVGSGTALQFARHNPGLFTSVSERSPDTDFVRQVASSDAVLAVMDPAAVVAATHARVPVTYIDSLFDFWEWSERASVVRDFAMCLAEDPEPMERLAKSDLNKHEQMRIPYFLTSPLVQGFPASAKADRYLQGGRWTSVGAVIWPSASRPLKAAPVERPVVSLSGTLSPIMPKAVAAKYVHIVDQALATTGLKSKALVMGSSFAVGLMRERGWKAAVMPLGHSIETMRRASYVLAPPGLTTAAEAAAVRTPLAFLPPANGSHVVNRQRLQGATGSYGAIKFLGDDRVLNTESTLAFDETFDAVLSSPFAMSELREQAESLIRTFGNPNALHAVTEAQVASATRMYGGLDGASVAAKDVMSGLGLGEALGQSTTLQVGFSR